jgi:hypothetical protein
MKLYNYTSEEYAGKKQGPCGRRQRPPSRIENVNNERDPNREMNRNCGSVETVVADITPALYVLILI